MSGKLNRAAYEGLIRENLAWLESLQGPREREHVIAIVKASADHEYRDEPRLNDPHSPEEAARLLLGLGPDDEGIETLAHLQSLKTRARGFDLVQEIAARLTRDAEHQRQERHVSIGEARIRADALALHLGAFARIVKDAAALAAGGDLAGALALLRK